MSNIAIATQKIALNQSLDAIISEFMSYLNVKRRKASTITTYINAIRQFWAFTQARGTGLDGCQTVTAWRDAMNETGKAASTIQLYITAIKRFVAWAVKAGYVQTKVADGINEVEVDRIEKDFRRDCLTENQARQLLDSVDRTTLAGMRDYALLALMTTCGLRDCEISRAKIGDLTTFNGVCTLYVHGKGHGAADAKVKPGAKTELAIRQYLAERVETDQEAPLFASVSNRNATGKPIDPKSISRLVKRYLDKVKLDGQNISPHSLRHTAATVALRQGRSLQEVQSMMRHKSINTTMIYAHNLDFANRKAEQCVEDVIM